MINNKYLSLLDKQDSLSLYIHIPFCTTKCYYCAFYSESKKYWDDTKVSDFLLKLFKELELIKLHYNKKIFDTVFIGGGNPGILSYNQLRELLIKIGPSKETTFEINPETLTKDHLNLFKEGLATRISLGIQSFNDKILTLLGRNAKYSDNIRAINIIKELDNLNIDINNNYFVKNKIISKSQYINLNTKIKYSFDLMTSLPTQTLDDSINDINILLNNTNLSHLSLYCLSVEEGTYLYNLVKDKKIQKNDDVFEKDLLENIWKYLDKIGFEHYEVSNFCKGDNKCLHNLNYWTLSPYISIGPSSASTLYDNTNLIRLTNISTIETYLKDNLLDDYEVEELNKREHLEEYLIVSLRNKRGLSFKYMKDFFNIEKDEILDAFSQLNKDLYLIKKDTVSISEKGYIILDTIILDISIAFDKLF